MDVDIRKGKIVLTSARSKTESSEIYIEFSEAPEVIEKIQGALNKRVSELESELSTLKSALEK